MTLYFNTYALSLKLLIKVNWNRQGAKGHLHMQWYPELRPAFFGFMEMFCG